jgi:hypothetical protein
MLIERYCTCGAVLKVEVPKRKRNQVLINWFDLHDGPDHEPTDAAGAEAARMGTGTGMGRESHRARLVREAEQT